MLKKIFISNAGRVLALVVFAFALLTLEIPPADAQSCRWDGTAPLCSGECGGNETEVTRLDAIPDFWVPPFVNQIPPFGANCVTGTKALCCSTPGRTCRWDGTAPICEGECRAGEMQAEPPPGSSSGSACLTGSKVYCCRSTATGTSNSSLVVEAWSRLQLKHGGQFLDAEYCSTKVSLHPGSDHEGGACQLWRLVPAGGGWSRLQLKHGGQFLDAEYCSTKVSLHPGSDHEGGACQLWRLVPSQ